MQRLARLHRHHGRGDTFFAQFAQQHIAGEGSGIDRAAKLLPQVRYGADMIFVGMGRDDRHERLAAIGDEDRVGHLHPVAANGRRRTGQWHFFEGHAAIHHQPLPGVAVQIEIHADLATAPQGQKPEILETWNHVKKPWQRRVDDDKW